MLRKTLTFAALTLLVAGLGLAEEPTRWLNVTVTESHDNTNVQLHLPMSLVSTVLDAVNTEEFHGGKIDLELDHADIDWIAVLKAVREAPDAEFVKVDAPDADVRVTKQGGTFLIKVVSKEDSGEKVDVTVPASLLDAISVDEHNRLDVKALVARLSEVGNGDLVRVVSPDANVRVWVE